MSSRPGRFASAWEPAPRPAPEGVALFAVGDVHGHLAELDLLLGLIAPAVGETRGRGDEAHLVLIGDLIDRGPAGAGVLSRVLDLRAAWGGRLHVVEGNHDRLLADVLAAEAGAEDAPLARWRAKGGDDVLRELGVGRGWWPFRRSSGRIVAVLRERLGPERCGLVEGLEASWRCGPWLFVHAGVHPTRRLKDQDPADWRTMRDPFLGAGKWRHPFAVVHGHTIRGPEVLPHRVGLDSGCYRTGVMTAVEIRGKRLRFLCVSADGRPPGEAMAGLPGAAQGRRFGPVPAPDPGRAETDRAV